MDIIKFRINSTRPLLMHSEAGADPLDPRSIAHRAIVKVPTAQRTEEYYRRVARSEWEIGMYFDQKIGPYLPDRVIQACLREGATMSRLGAQVDRGVEVMERAVLIYDGPRTIQELWDQGFRDTRGVGVQGTNRVFRCRPMFLRWSAEFEVAYDESIINHDQVIKCLEDAGQYRGIGDHRPKFGRFNVEVLQ